MKMVCKAANRYGGQKRAFGDAVEVSRHDVRLVSALGWFVPFEEPTTTTAPKLQTCARTTTPPARNPAFANFLLTIPETDAEEVAVAQAALSPVVEPSLEEAKPKRTYQRRDMTAEGI